MNNKILILIICGIFMLSSVSVYATTTDNTPQSDPNVYTGTIYVSTTGNDTNKGYTPETSKHSVKKAVDMAPAGATVLVAPGTYIENGMLITKSLKLIGEDPETTIIKCTIYVKGKDVKVWAKGCTIRPLKYKRFMEVVSCAKGLFVLENCKILDFYPKDDAFVEAYRGNIIYIKCTLVKHGFMNEYEQLLQ